MDPIGIGYTPYSGVTGQSSNGWFTGTNTHGSSFTEDTFNQPGAEFQVPGPDILPVFEGVSPSFPEPSFASMLDESAFLSQELTNTFGANLFDNIAAFTPSTIPGPTIPPVVNAPATGERLTCSNGCPGSFGRPSEYRRHMKKHDRPRYRCPVTDCDRTFYRADKMRDHFNRGH